MKLDSLTKLFLKTLKDTFSGKLWKWLIGSAGSLFGILLFGKNFFYQSLSISIYIGISILIGLLILRFFLFFIVNVIQLVHFYYHESVYGDAIIFLRDSFSKIHSLRKKDEINDNDFTETMVILCNNLSSLFEKKTKSKCSVSIKVPTKGIIDEQSSVKNLYRDSFATKTRDTELYKKTNHTIIGNTPYQKIVNNILKGNKEKLHYLNNDINSNADYENTSREVYQNSALPYLSELVYPILPFTWDKKTNNYNCIGFICIDCDKKNSFDDKYDIGIISGVADGIYDIITLRNSLKEK
jgi:hypothetical protein